MMNGFMYGNIFEEEERFQRQAIFPKLLCQNADDFSFSSTSFNRDAVKAGTGRRFLGGLLDDSSYCYTLEVSFYSYIMGGANSAIPYTEEACILFNLEHHLMLQACLKWISKELCGEETASLLQIVYNMALNGEDLRQCIHQ
ncbi:cytosolic carboxypeptidase 6-like isoform X2 [Rhinatrema bivittatum]|uniref:cytosolic carboxypeptidase 6-like isoform X2 n=1 Tax=Rhinatrema bivittatum TaxID=194408 RepID=UPI0011275DB9|nr:cytosolic carboxypeptidase 6-like isoform X2 [Rhinatrema bivittatum]